MMGFEPTKHYAPHLECGPFDQTWVHNQGGYGGI
jgi:hypothetical protein